MLNGQRAKEIINSLIHLSVQEMEDLLASPEILRDNFVASEIRRELLSRRKIEIPFVEDDGGRSKYFRGKDAGDCVTRAITIASGRNYKEVYDALAVLNKEYSRKGKKSARNGVSANAYKRYFGWDLGWVWTPTMQVGQGCKVHLRPDELPNGRIVVRVSKHLAAVIDGVLHDTYDCSRGGTRCVYGYWQAPA